MRAATHCPHARETACPCESVCTRRREGTACAHQNASAARATAHTDDDRRQPHSLAIAPAAEALSSKAARQHGQLSRPRRPRSLLSARPVHYPARPDYIRSERRRPLRCAAPDCYGSRLWPVEPAYVRGCCVAVRLARRAKAAAVASKRFGRHGPSAPSGSAFAARSAGQLAQARTGRPGRVRDAETIQLLLCSPGTRVRTSPGVTSLGTGRARGGSTVHRQVGLASHGVVTRG